MVIFSSLKTLPDMIFTCACRLSFQRHLTACSFRYVLVKRLGTADEGDQIFPFKACTSLPAQSSSASCTGVGAFSPTQRRRCNPLMATAIRFASEPQSCLPALRTAYDSSPKSCSTLLLAATAGNHADTVATTSSCNEKRCLLKMPRSSRYS